MFGRQHGAQCGIAMVAVLVMMVAVSLLGLTIVNMGGLEQKISGNFQLMSESFDLTEAGIQGAMSLRERTGDPFVGPPTLAVYDADNTDADGNPVDVSVNPFATANPISGLSGVTANLTLYAIDQLCPRRSNASSTNVSHCDIYYLESRHAHVDTGARSEVTQHVVEELPAAN